MTFLFQIDCFSLNMKFWRFLGILPKNDVSKYYSYYSLVFILFFVIFYDLLCTINFYFLPRHLDVFIEEMMFYFTEIAVTSKVLTFFFMRDKIVTILKTLESDVFQPNTDEGLKIIESAKKFNVRYWKIVAGVSFTSNLTHVLSPLFAHIFAHVDLELPVCSFSFLSDEFKAANIYLLYFYQSFGMHFHMLYNLNIDTFLLGVMIFSIAQLDILNEKLRTVTKETRTDHTLKSSRRIVNNEEISNANIAFVSKLNSIIKHYTKVWK